MARLCQKGTCLVPQCALSTRAMLLWTASEWMGLPAGAGCTLRVVPSPSGREMLSVLPPFLGWPLVLWLKMYWLLSVQPGDWKWMLLQEMMVNQAVSILSERLKAEDQAVRCWSHFLQEWRGPVSLCECQKSGQTYHLSKVERMQRNTAVRPLLKRTVTESWSSSFQKELTMGRELPKLWRIFSMWIVLFPHPSNALEFAVSLQGWETSCFTRSKSVSRFWVAAPRDARCASGTGELCEIALLEQ